MVRNYRKDGSEIDRLADYVLSHEDFPEVYAVLEKVAVNHGVLHGTRIA